MKKGKLIVIEGTDGSGKTVQTNLLVERLLSEGNKVQMTDFPQYGKSFFANMIEHYLKGEFGWPQALRKVSPYLASLLYAGDRWEAGSLMHKWLDDGDIIISNRYVCSNMAHQGAKISNAGERKKFFEWIEELEYKVYAIPKPDITIYLHVPIEISRELIKARAKESEGLKSKVDLHEGDIRYMQGVQETYMELADSDSNWCTIECAKNNQMKSREEIAEEVWGAVMMIDD